MKCYSIVSLMRKKIIPEILLLNIIKELLLNSPDLKIIKELLLNSAYLRMIKELLLNSPNLRIFKKIIAKFS